MENYKKYEIKKQKISYWKNKEIKTAINRRSKFTDDDIKYMIKLAENQTTSNMGSRKIAILMNKKFKDERRDLIISQMATWRILNKNIGKPRKIKKVFYINNTRN